MGKLILILLLLFRSFTLTPGGIAGGTVEGYDRDRYMDLMERRDERGPVSLDEQVRVLKELGITLSDETLKSTQEIWSEESFGYEYWLPLLYEGWGSYDYKTGTWTPSSSQVYSFDAEFYDVEGMYQLYLQGLQSISQGELMFSDVSADYSKVDYDSRDGTVEVKFTLNGQKCTFLARYMGDWLDLMIRDAVNGALEELGVEKRFYATDGGQGEIIFFCTEEWARAFEEATLCYMSDTAKY